MNSNRNRSAEIESSFKTGAKALAVGAVLILVLSVTGMPESSSGDALLGRQVAHAVTGNGAMSNDPGDDVHASSGEPVPATAHIDVPFTVNQGDVEELPPQF